MQPAESIKYIGVNDYDITLFEAQYPVENGMSYNSYLILDEKKVVLDTVDARYTEEWLQNIEKVCGDTAPDFLVVQHMEPDHSGSICRFMDKYTETIIIASAKSFVMLKQFFGNAYNDRRIIVKEGDCICLGKHTLTFLEAPMIHWPEVIMTYEKETGTLFTADAFGKFGALKPDEQYSAPKSSQEKGTERNSAEEKCFEEDWVDEARRYYINIVGKYGVQVMNLLKKLDSFTINTICPLHGPILCENLSYYVNLYKTWASYQPEKKGILIAYTSIYGNTEKAVMLLAEMLQDNNDSERTIRKSVEKGSTGIDFAGKEFAGTERTGKEIVVRNLTHCDMSQVVSEAFCYDKLVLATPTYNNDIFPPMREFIAHLTERNYQNRKIALIENGSWAPTAAKTIKAMFDKMKNITFYDDIVTIESALSDNSYQQLLKLAEAIKNCENL